MQEIHSLAQQVRQRAPAGEDWGLQELVDLAEEIAAFQEMQDEIEAAEVALEAHRDEFEALMEDPGVAAQQARHLFSEEPFAQFQFTADDVHEAFEAVGFPVRHRSRSEKDAKLFQDAILYLTDEQQREHLARHLLMQLPEYVEAERYLDAWLIRYSAYQMLDAPERSNPFLGIMFQHGFMEWAERIESEQWDLFEKLGIDPVKVAGMSPDEREAWIQERIDDPAVQDRLGAFFEAHPTLRQQAVAETAELERDALRLPGRDDADRILLSPEEVKPWLPTLIERLQSLEAKAEEAEERGEWPDPDIVDEMQAIMVEVAREMAPAVFTQERLDQLARDLREYRRELRAAGEDEAARHAGAALIFLNRDEPPRDQKLLISICLASLNAALENIGDRTDESSE